MTNNEVIKMFKDTFGTPAGDKCLKHLKETFVDRPVFRSGQTYEDTAFREGERSVIMKILKEVNRNG
jgi:GGDEF domain-containing protein